MSGAGEPTTRAAIGRGPALIAAAILGVGALGGLGWSVVRTTRAMDEATTAVTTGRPAPGPVHNERGRGEAAGQTSGGTSGSAVNAPLVKALPEAARSADPAAGKEPPATTASKSPAATPSSAPADSSAAPEAAKSDKVPKPEKPALPAKVNLNTATAAELELLPGIGPSLAQRIIDHRQKSGKFRTVAELDKVKGIGPKTIEKLKPLVTVE